MLRAVHDCGGSRTRAQLTRELDLARGTASVLVGELIESELLAETPAAEHARGRPTLVPGPHPRGPQALAVDLREDEWEIAVCELGGRATTLEVRPHDGTPEGAFLPIGAALRALVGPRTVGVGVAVAGPVRQAAPGEDPLVDIAHLRWRDVPVGELLSLGAVPLHLGNDARLAALAEARRGQMRGVEVGLHLHIAFDLGGSLLVGGRPLTGASGTAGEFGHMPMAGDDEPCLCGTSGCWGVQVGSNALLRRLGLPYGGGKGRAEAGRMLARARSGDRAAAEALHAVARALGKGAGALVNAHDPALVTLSGFGEDLLGESLREAYVAALMEMRRPAPPPVVASALGWRGPLLGAMESVFDAFLTPNGVERWRHARMHGVMYTTSASAPV
ncbi:ROK family protein [Nonomuraea sp. NPDC050328]|uniref:ROK family protein n=1 Tax=Nonomuraea sp. NPDC050328 TaxID=3364361 RepID=UPI00379565F1